MEDDREQFGLEKREDASRMGADEGLRRSALDLYAAADRYNFSYQWTWLGLPIIQIPNDLMICQEIVWATRPQLLIETGVARGGSLIFWASMMQLVGDGVVVGVDVDIRPHNRAAIEDHPLSHRVRLIEGSSTDPEVVAMVAEAAGVAERVAVALDSNHTHDHVLAELELYGPMVTPGQYLIVSDTVIEHIPAQTHRPRPWGPGNGPATAVEAFLAGHPEFRLDDQIDDRILMSSNPGGYLVREADVK